MVQAPVLSQDRPVGVAAAPERPLRLLVLVQKAKGIAPNQRFRLEQWAPRVAADHGIDMDFVPFESPELTAILQQPGQRPRKAAWVLYDFARRLGPLVRSRRYDAVLVCREAALIGPAMYERAFAWANVPMLFDFDDAIWHPAQISKANGVFSKLHFFGKTKTICRLARGVVAGNRYLASYAEDARGTRENVYVVPTSIELERYAAQPELADDERFCVVWSGSISTLAHFEHAREALERLAARRPVTVKVICNEPPSRPIAGAENVFVKWTEAGEAETLGAAHVGIMPLPDNEFTRGKCGLKALQFMSVGRPVVTSPVGMNEDLITSGVNGILARTADDWVDAFERLAASAELRARLGAAGRKTVETGYSAEVVSGVFARAVRQTLATSAS